MNTTIDTKELKDKIVQWYLSNKNSDFTPINAIDAEEFSSAVVGGVSIEPIPFGKRSFDEAAAMYVFDHGDERTITDAELIDSLENFGNIVEIISSMNEFVVDYDGDGDDNDEAIERRLTRIDNAIDYIHGVMVHEVIRRAAGK